MKKILIFLLLTFAALPLSAHAAFDATMKYGSRGESVTELQEFLAAQKLYQGPVTGNYFSLTQTGVKNFQRREKIKPVNGVFGLAEQKRANDLLAAAEDDTDTVSTTIEVPTTTAYMPWPIFTRPAMTSTVYVPVNQVPPMTQTTTIPVTPDTQTTVPDVKVGAAVPEAQPVVQSLTLDIVSDGPFQSSWTACHRAVGNSFAAMTQAMTNEDPNMVRLNASTHNEVEQAYAQLALIVSQNGTYLRDATVNVTTQDARQNKTIVGTGRLVTASADKSLNKTTYGYPVFGYAYTYYFESAGLHTVTFTVNGQSRSITLYAYPENETSWTMSGECGNGRPVGNNLPVQQ